MDDIRSCGADRASYHLSHFRSYAELQVEIDHRNATLLRTRYVDQRGQKCAGILDGGIGDANYGCVILKNEIVELLRSEILSLEGGTFISPGRQPWDYIKKTSEPRAKRRGWQATRDRTIWF